MKILLLIDELIVKNKPNFYKRILYLPSLNNCLVLTFGVVTKVKLVIDAGLCSCVLYEYYFFYIEIVEQCLLI